MPPKLIPDDDDYASDEDSDFAPDAAPLQVSDEPSDSESDEDESEANGVKKPKQKSTKRKRSEEQEGEAEDAGFENSGDEAIIEKGRKKRNKKGKKGDDSDDGGEGGLIKTRRMRALEVAEKKPLVDTTTATVDVDALWESMLSDKLPQITGDDNSNLAKDTITTEDGNPKLDDATTESENVKEPTPNFDDDDPDAMVVIKRTYKFAGQVHTEEKLVPKNSAEAKLYLSSKSASEPVTDETSPFTKPKRLIKKRQRSRFEPVIEGLAQRTDIYLGKRGVNNIGGLGSKVSPAKKLNTVEKSAMDWAGFVDKEGIKDELDAASKSKGAYKARQEFLARVEQKRDEEARRARAK
ncbi:hypothetical protein B7463_g10114, partial [Scytalidium lignicola]